MMDTQHSTRRIGLIGVGLVGTVLAKRLLAEGFGVLGYDVAAERVDELKRRGGQGADSPAAVASEVDCVLLSLPDSSVVRYVVEGPDGVLHAGRLPSYVIDTTTGDPDDTEALAERLAQRGIALLDATISGSSRQLAGGTAVLMVGGEKAAFDACLPVLRVLSDRLFHLGPTGSGSKAKLATNLVLGLNRLVLAEGLVFAEKLGLDLGAFLELLRAGPAYSAAVDVKGTKMRNGDFTPEARLKQHSKDVSLILKHAGKAGQELPLSAVHADILAKAIGAGEGDLDTSAIINEIRRRTSQS